MLVLKLIQCPGLGLIFHMLKYHGRTAHILDLKWTDDLQHQELGNNMRITKNWYHSRRMIAIDYMYTGAALSFGLIQVCRSGLVLYSIVLSHAGGENGVGSDISERSQLPIARIWASLTNRFWRQYLFQFLNLLIFWDWFDYVRPFRAYDYEIPA